MILKCNSCSKKFVVPDGAITASGRVVQCGSCGNKWKQFPINEIKKTSQLTRSQKIIQKPRPAQQKTKKTKKTLAKKTREIDLYSPEYLKKKHGIILDNVKPEKNIATNKKTSFGFYNSLILFIVFTIALLKILHFSQDFIIINFPFSEIYLNILFENIKNIFEILKSLVTYY